MLIGFSSSMHAKNFDWENMAILYAKIYPHFDYGEYVEDYIQEFHPKKWRQYENDEFLLEEKELKIALEKAIADLPEPQRIVFLLSRIDKKTYREIAEIIGISRQAVEKRMYKALDQLRKITKNIK